MGHQVGVNQSVCVIKTHPPNPRQQDDHESESRAQPTLTGRRARRHTEACMVRDVAVIDSKPHHIGWSLLLS